MIENSTQKRLTFKSAYDKSLFHKINPKERNTMKYKYLGKIGISNKTCV